MELFKSIRFMFAPSLTNREKEVMKLAMDDYSQKQIADKLHISPSTVSTHSKNIREKTKTNNLLVACIKAARKGLINL